MNDEAPQTIWQRLGIEPTSDERAIKKAYARQLKQTPPDQDPKAFQKLREARDDAIWEAKYGFYEDEDFYDEEETGEDFNPLKDETPTTNEETIEDPIANEENISAIDGLSDDGDQNAKAPTPVHISLEEETSIPHTPVAPLESSHVMHDHDDEHPSVQRNDGLGQENGFKLEITNEEIEERLENLLGPWSGWKINEWEHFINDVRESPFEASSYAEYSILDTLSEKLQETEPKTHQENSARLKVLTLLNQEFGWTQNDRRVYNMLGDEKAKIILDTLRGLSSHSSKNPGRAYYDASGFPFLTEEDFEIYLGKNNSTYETYYNKCRDEGRQLTRSWSWLPFIGGPFWMALRCNDGLESLTGIVYIVALFFLGYGLENEKLIQTLIGATSILSLHFINGFYAKRMVISTMAEILTRFEQEESVSEEERKKQIKKIGQGGFKALTEFIWGMIGIAVIGGVIFAITLNL